MASVANAEAHVPVPGAFAVALALPLFPVSGWLAGQATGMPGLASFWTPFALFVIVGALDFWIGTDKSNPSDAEAARRRESGFLRALPALALPLCAGLVVWGAWVSTSPETTVLAVLGTTWSVGAITGTLGITAAHELVHRPPRSERATGAAMLALVSYGTFKIEHIRGHHVAVATPEDPSSAPLGRSLYRFIPEAVAHNVATAWRLEASRLRREGQAAFGFGNEALRATLVSAAIAAGLGAVFGPWAVVFFVGQSLVAVALLETINYIQHYGLQRQRLEGGRYERTTVRHSWNSPYRLTNAFLFNLQRHSDHHAHAARRYGELRHHEESPQLPAGYAAMVPLAMVPPLWRRVMDRRAAAYAER